ncbi:gephyrin-like molybdotransferase Glp [Roseovarius sp. Pro17]|uniref:molybdopterin-binding protein n=1 Tax=Roseovarius sp. Pro17 TaxID=3108175 RepID=UPI002D767837|nr:gephyrin-like molybdotransferase Glp [Roseovarius sp. Pro17]
MSGFDTVVIVDWSARSAPSPARPTADAIWIAVARGGAAECSYHRTRSAAMGALTALFDTELAAGRRVLAGFDFPFGYPRGFARALTGGDNPLAVWGALAARIKDGEDNANNRFDVARAINAALPGIGPFWGCPDAVADDVLPAKGNLRTGHGLPEKRECEARLPRAQSCWKLYTTGSVGSQALLGLPRLHHLRQRYGDVLSVAPFQSPTTPIVLAEVYPSLLADHIAASAEPDEIKDRAQVRVLAEALHAMGGALETMLREGNAEEGWILGLGHEDALSAPPAPPPLRDDCFAMPAGVEWTPVDDALAALRAGLHPIVQAERCKVADACGRVLAEPATALRASPPHANSAIDGYGFAYDSLPPGDPVLPIAPGRSAAGAPYEGNVPRGHALRILTGATVPEGVDTIVLEEDTRQSAGQIAFRAGIKRGANTRKAGEDMSAGDKALPKGRVMTPADLALLASVGIGEVSVYRRLRVAVISTGDELIEAGGDATKGQIFDANRPMLLAQIAAWGMEAIDMGRVSDDRAALRAALDDAASRADVILTSGGASAGDEDHVSALLTEAGAMQQWRIALKPGRPLALGLWNGAPVFGLPGNPVAALVCTLIFARPALGLLAGAGWTEPQGFNVSAGFEKSKKPGRREYLRARIRDGRAEVFASEGSGRVSSLSWAEGLVELPDGAAQIAIGDPVRYIPFGSFAL